MAKNPTSNDPKVDEAKAAADKAAAEKAATDNAGAEAKPAAEKKTSDKDASAAEPSDARTITVTCLIAAGRRRGGRRWPAGPTDVKFDDLTEEEWAAVRADPMLATSMPVKAED